MITRALAAFLLAAAFAPATLAQDAASAGTPTSILPGATGDKAVMDDIERTLKELSGHVTVGAKRIPISGGGGGAAADVEVPQHLDLAIGKAESVALPSDAREVVIGEPKVVEATVSSRRRLFVMARAAGRSNVFVLGSAGQIIARMEIAVGVDGQAVREAIRAAMPDEPVTVETQGPTVILSGSVSSDSAAGRLAAIVSQFVAKPADVVNLTKVSREQQVLIQVKVAEVNRTALKEFGVNLSGIGNNPVFQALTLSGSTSGSVSTGTAFGSLTWTGVRGISAVLKLLEQRDLMHSLAEPNLVAISGETAQMLAGGEYPIPSVDTNGNLSITYKPFGVSLSFVPMILDSSRINMKVFTEVSAINSAIKINNSSGYSYNGFSVRRAASTIELPNGGTLMIAGLLQNDVAQSMAGLPGVMDLPVLGRLFRSDSFKRAETELVVIVTATLVRPTDMARITTPNDAVSPGGDLDMWLFDRMTGRYLPAFAKDQQVPVKTPPFGFILDEFAP